MKITNFEIYADLLKEESGLVITHEKSYLLESRLKPIAQSYGHPSVESMALALQGIPDTKLVREIVEALTTNETFFFRDKTPFDAFKSIIMPYMEKTRAAGKSLNIWSAAASTGQEPYSLCMLLKEAAPLWRNWTFNILGTDLCQNVLNQAQSGIYTQFEVQRGLPIQMLLSYFTQADDRWKISDDIINMVTYQPFNLLDDMSPLGTFDVIFCRNVLIYFDEGTKARVLEKLAERLAPDGFLILGGTETVLGLTKSLKPVPSVHGLYAKADSVHVEQAA